MCWLISGKGSFLDEKVTVYCGFWTGDVVSLCHIAFWVHGHVMCTSKTEHAAKPDTGCTQTVCILTKTRIIGILPFIFALNRLLANILQFKILWIDRKRVQQSKLFRNFILHKKFHFVVFFSLFFWWTFMYQMMNFRKS